MIRFGGTHRLPRAGVDVIDSAAVAFSMIAHLAARPSRSETIALLLDRQHRGISVLVVSGTREPDAMFDVLDAIVHGARTGGADDDGGGDRNGGGAALGGLVLASVRPGGGVEPGDLDRWLEASDLLALHDAVLLEWFVVGNQVTCPRDLLGEPPRWRR